MRIIPAIDIIDGKCVRLTKGDYATQKVYSEDPLDMAKRFEDNGVKSLHLVDLDGAKAKHIVNYKVLEAIAGKTSLKVDFGGGVKTSKDLDIAFQHGADKVTAGSIAVHDPDLVLEWLRLYGAEKIILGADCKDKMIVTNGWAEQSSIGVVDFIKQYQTSGVTQVICTDIDVDGMLLGPSFDLYKKILAETDMQLIASGGVSSIDDLQQLSAIGCNATIVGKAIYEGRISLTQIQELC